MEESGFEPQESHSSAHILTHEGFRDAQERKSSGLGDDMGGRGETCVEEAAQVIGSGSSSWCQYSLQNRRKKEEQVCETVTWSCVSRAQQTEMSSK